MVIAGANFRVRFQYLVQKIAKNGKVPLTIVRAGKKVSVQLPVVAEHPMLIPDLKGEYPSYFVYGPIVFSAATAQFVAGISTATAMNFFAYIGSPLITRRGDKPAFDGEELVVISSPFFPHKLSKGYSNPASDVVSTINGTPIKNLRHCVQVLRDCRDDYICIHCAERAFESLVFPRKEMLAATDEILNDNGVRSQATPAELAVWNGKK